MKTICIYYDLNDPSHQYHSLISYLETFQDYAQAGSRIWFVNSSKECESIRDEINALEIPSGDRIIVFNVGVAWSSNGLKPETSQWLHASWKS